MVLDSTHPGAVRSVLDAIDPARTWFLVSSKSGTTLETLSFFHFFWDVVSRVSAEPGSQFVAVTDPGTPLQRMAENRGFAAAVPTPPDVGGRYSALTPFGLLPAALIGAEADRIRASAAAMADAAGPEVHAAENPALVLGAVIGVGALGGRDKLTFVVSPELDAFPVWLEQLVAESTGKQQKGIVPVAGEDLGAPDVYGDDRLFVHITLGDDDGDGPVELLEAAGHPVVRIHLEEATDLGAEMLRAEIAVAAAGSILGIHPFDQPDVQLAKDLAKRAMAGELPAGRCADGRARRIVPRWGSGPARSPPATTSPFRPSWRRAMDSKIVCSISVFCCVIDIALPPRLAGDRVFSIRPVSSTRAVQPRWWPCS